jgi:hypothetical protein
MKIPSGWDFAGWAAKYDVLCTDGTTIKPGFGASQKGAKVPLMWNHNHESIGEVLGHAILDPRPEGIYCYAYCNKSEEGQKAKECVSNGDIDAFSIWANNLKRKAGDIYHGLIREVSLVMAGADKTALIDTIVAHGDYSDEEAEIMFLGGYAEMQIAHSEDDDEGKDPDMKDDSKTPEQQEGQEEGLQHADDGGDKAPAEAGGNKTVGDVLKTLNEEQKKAMAIVIAQILESQGKGSKETEDNKANTNKEETDVKHNAFSQNAQQEQNFISHDDLKVILKDAKRLGSLRESWRENLESGVLSHAEGDPSAAGVDYGIANLDYLFPDARTIEARPDFIKRDMSWVDGVLNSTHHTPFSRVKSIHADITEDKARALGYMKGKYKKEEVFALLKRVTEPQTIIKKQRFDKDDIDDITDIDVIAWVKAEMQMMLREEVARAILIGDGRPADDDDKIHEDRIRPVFNDADLYTVKVAVEIPANATDEVKAKALIKTMVKARKLYKGSGNPTMYTTQDELTNCLLLEDGIGHRLYKSEAEVATAMRARAVVDVEVMEGLTIEIDENGTKKRYPVAGTEVNLADYNIGTNKGAKTDFFDDFDLDYNQMKYLYETRMSGALIKPYSAVTFYYKTVNA